MGALPWFKFHSAAPTNIKVQALRRRIGPEADAYLYRLWAYCARDMPSGRFEGESADGLEMAVGWPGEQGALVAALVAVRLLDRDAGCLVVHDWEREQGAHVSKFLKDRVRANAKRRNPSANAEELQCDDKSREPPATVAGPSRDGRENLAGPSRGASPLSVVVSSSRDRGVGEEDSAPVTTSLFERLCAAYKSLRGSDYGTNAMGLPVPRDAAALAELLGLAKNDHAEILARWRNGLGRQRYPRVSALRELPGAWDHCAAAEAAPQSFQRPANKGFAGIEYRTGEGNDFS